MTPRLLYDRFGIAWALVAVCAAGCASSDRQTSDPWGRSLRSADGGKRGRQRVVDAAIANAKEAEPPKILPETHFAAGRLFESQGQFDKAVHQYRKAAAVNHNYTEAYHRLGLTLSRTGKHEEAAQALRRAVELKSDSAQLRNDLGFELLLSRQWPEAEEHLVHAVNLKPDFARAYVNLGIVQSKRGRFSEALSTFRTVLPEADAYYNLGLMYRGQRRLDEAVAAFRHVLSLDPKFTAAHKQLDQIVAQYEPPSPLDRELTVEGDPESPRQEARSVKLAAPSATLRESQLPPSHVPTDRPEQVGVAPTDEQTWDRAFEALNAMMNMEDSKTQVPAARDETSGSDVPTSNFAGRADSPAGSEGGGQDFGPLNAPTECLATDGPVCPADDHPTYSRARGTSDTLQGVCRADDPRRRDGHPLVSLGHGSTHHSWTADPNDEPVSCVDRRALLRELGEALSVVRNQIECLESNGKVESTPYAFVDAFDPRLGANHPSARETDRDPLTAPPAPETWREPFDTWGRLGWPVPSRAQLASDMTPPRERSEDDGANKADKSSDPKSR